MQRKRTDYEKKDFRPTQKFNEKNAELQLELQVDLNTLLFFLSASSKKIHRYTARTVPMRKIPQVSPLRKTQVIHPSPLPKMKVPPKELTRE